MKLKGKENDVKENQRNNKEKERRRRSKIRDKLFKDKKTAMRRVTSGIDRRPKKEGYRGACRWKGEKGRKEALGPNAC